MILYTQPGCPQCRMVNILLKSKNIECEECQDLEIMTSKGINHTPALEVEDGRILQGKDMMEYIKGLK